MSSGYDGTVQAGDNVVGSGSFIKLVPEGMTAHWRFGWAAPKLPTFSVPLVEVRLTLNDTGDTLTGLDLAFVCDPGVYAEIESWGWFDLEQTQAQQMGVTFEDGYPVRVEVSLDPDYADSVLSEPPDSSDPPGTIARLLKPLLDPKVDGTIHMPSVFVWQRVVQETDRGTIGFTRGGRIVDVNAPQETPVAEKTDGDRVVIENFQIGKPEKAHWIEPMVPGSLQLEDGPPLDAVVERVRFVLSAEGTPYLDATFQLPYEDYLAAQFHGGFGISQDAVDGFTDFDEGLPVYVDARLHDEVFQEVLHSESGQPEQVLRRVVRALTEESEDTRLRSAGSWTFTAVQQQPEGHSFRIGYRNRTLS